MVPDQALDLNALSEDERRAVFAALEPVPSDRRAHERFPLMSQIRLTVRLLEGPAERFWCIPKDISQGGIGFMHGAPLPIGIACLAEMQTPSGESFEVGGRVTRCTPVAGKIHEIGVAFDAPVEAPAIAAIVDSATAPERWGTDRSLRKIWARLAERAEDIVESAACHRDPVKMARMVVELQTLSRMLLAAATPVAGGRAPCEAASARDQADDAARAG
jgi:hypothetical protein